MLTLSEYVYSQSFENTRSASTVVNKNLTYHHTNQKVARSVPLMSTSVDFIIFTDDKKRGNRAIDEAIVEINRIVKVMSEWNPDSEISRVNQNAGIKPVKVSEELYRVLEASINIGKKTQGAFDITFKSAGKLWNFRNQTVPSESKIIEAIKNIDYRNVQLDPTNKAVLITNKNTQIGLGGIAKGYAVDRAVQIIKKHQFTEFAVNAGGDLYAQGRHSDSLWKVGIQNPRAKDDILATLPVGNMAVATSGDYERFFIHEGTRYSHIIDPRTGYPASACQSVTVLAPRTFWADALATGIFVLGPQDGLALVNSMEEIEALIVDRNGEVLLSRGLQK